MLQSDDKIELAKGLQVFYDFMQLAIFIIQDEVKSGGYWVFVPAKGLKLLPTTKSATLGLALLQLIYLQL